MTNTPSFTFATDYTDHEIELLERYAGISMRTRGGNRERWAAADAVNMVHWLRRVIPRGRPKCFGCFETGHTICNGYEGDDCKQVDDCIVEKKKRIAIKKERV